MSFGTLSSIKPASFVGFWNYNRTNYEFDIGQRWKRYTVGRAMAVKQAAMFREDVADLTMVTVKKMGIYTPMATVCCGYCVTVFIEGRSGLKFPAPPTFISGIYLQCLGIGFAFMALSAWLVFHAGMRAMVAAVSLRTRTVRLPLPTQHQLDQARKLGSSYEEVNFYDMFRVPYVMPNLAKTPEHSDDDDPDYAGSIGGEPSGKKKGKKGGKGEKSKKATPQQDGSGQRKSMRMPYRSGAPEWIEREYEHYEDNPKSAPSTFGNGPATEPFEHFELIRKAQKDWWCAEVYGRICLLTGQIHLVQGFGFWLTIHLIAELGMYWCAQVMAGGFSAAVWLMFHLDVLPDKGGRWPVEAAGPFLSALTLLLQYAHNPTPFIIDLSRVLAIACIALQVVFTFRLFILAHPANQQPGYAREMANQKNLSASCDLPTWLPTAYQHVQYMVAPPKSATGKGKDGEKQVDPMESCDDVDMMPWRAVRGMYIVTIILWFVLLIGRIVECAMGERMLVSNPGFPPWTRIGQWDGWESGPITSKHYAHVTPMRGHFAWKYGQGPNGAVEIWPSDLYGFHPEADGWWADENNPKLNAPPGAARHKIESYPLEVIPKPPNFEAHGGHAAGPIATSPDYGKYHRRLQKSFLQADVVRPLVPAGIKWPSNTFEPDFIACAPSTRGSQVAAFTVAGHGAVMSSEAASGKVAGLGASFNIDGLPSDAVPHGITWNHEGLSIVSRTGGLHSCTHVLGSSSFKCQDVAAPAVPLERWLTEESSGLWPTVVAAAGDGSLVAAVAAEGGEVKLMKLGGNWELTAKVRLPMNEDALDSEQPSVVALSAADDHLVVTASDGATYHWELNAGIPSSTPHREAPAAAEANAIGSSRSWKGACLLPTGKIIRLASRWQRNGAAMSWQPEILF